MPVLPKLPEKFSEPIWEQQPNEHHAHYTYFMTYLTLKPYERTLQNTWKIVMQGTTKEGTRYSRYFGEVARHWHWIERAAAKDLFELQNAQNVWQERDKQRREDAYEIGEKLVKQAKRVLQKIEGIPEHDLKTSLGEAKDVAVAGAQLQESAIPSIQLAVDQMEWLIRTLPPEKRNAVITTLRQARENPRGFLPQESTVDGEFTEVADEEEEE